jgi:hypothetical protein
MTVQVYEIIPAVRSSTGAGAINAATRMNRALMQFRRGNNNYGRTKLLWPNGELDLAAARLHAFKGLG